MLKIYDDFRDVSGLTLPFTTHAGAAANQPQLAKSTLSRVTINGTLADSLFEPPPAN